MKNSWIIKKIGDAGKLKDAVLIEGMPGIGNVGKIAIDFIVENKKAKKIYDLFSYDLPNSVFIKENNLVELPKIEIYHFKQKNCDILLLGGDVQPMIERSCYEFCDAVLDICEELGCKKVITTGGIGLNKVPSKPRVYCTANNKAILKDIKSKSPKVKDRAYGTVGPLVGVSGVLLGLAEMRKIAGAALLAETLAHPMYLGMAGARNILEVLDDYLDLKLSLKNIDKEIKEIEEEVIKKTHELQQAMKTNEKKAEKQNYIV